MRLLPKQQHLNVLMLSGLIALTIKTQWLPSDQSTVRELNVQRINVMEPSGHPRLVIANTSHAPKAIKEGKEFFDPGPRPGMIFYNDEGTENGGFVFRGFQKDGKVEHGLHLSFDRYNQDQTLALQHIEQDGRLITGLNLVDRPQYPIDQYMTLMLAVQQGDTEAQSKLRQLEQQQPDIHGHRRAFYGTVDRKAMLQLNDPQGKKRIEMAVGKDGQPQLIFYAADGSELLRLPEASQVTR
ncbi:hypothetical protein ACFO3I_16085 [Rheinheimera marina]|uniref:Uncharacterized protein n=1 Tax=Rheinheimera marina TaxID=1774958 RepID=A0ABV9JQQ2_9GAMM